MDRLSLVFGLITELVTESYLASRSPGAVLKPQPGFRCEICSLLTYETNNAPSRTRAETAGASRASVDDLGPHPITPLLLRSTTTTRPSDHADQRVTTRRDVESGHQSVSVAAHPSPVSMSSNQAAPTKATAEPGNGKPLTLTSQQLLRSTWSFRRPRAVLPCRSCSQGYVADDADRRRGRGRTPTPNTTSQHGRPTPPARRFISLSAGRTLGDYPSAVVESGPRVAGACKA